MIVLALWLAACRPSPPTEGPFGPAGESASTDTATATTGAPSTASPVFDTSTVGSADSAAPAVPLLDEALLGRCMPDFEAEADAPSMHRVTLSGARCNDGTPAVMFVRPGAQSDDWVVYFEGGSRCADGEGCAARWCAEDAYNATKMSSRWAPEARGVQGLHGTTEANPFADWNQVFVYYCTSDFWVGQRSDVVLTTDDGVDLRLHFEGALVVDATFDWLMAGGTSDDGAVTMPSVRDAERLLLAGSSAGAMAVTQHGDAIAATLPGVEVLAVLDALSTPDPAQMYTDGLEALWEAELDRQYHDEILGLYDGRLHAGCLATYAGGPERCWEPSFVHEVAMGLPRLVHHDLRDRVLSDSYLALGASLPGYMNGSKAMLERLALRPDVSVHGPSCGTHTTLSEAAVFFGQSVEGVTMADALDRFVAGEGVQVIDPGPGSASVCR